MENTDRRVARGQKGEIPIYPARRRLARVVLLGLIMTVASLWALISAEPNTYVSSRALIKVMGAIGVILFGFGTLFGMVRALSSDRSSS